MWSQKNFDIQGHRGARGLFPENSIPGFIEALRLGVNTLEMDVVVSKDNQLVVSHEPWFSSEICVGVTDEKEKYNIYRMTYEEIKSFDCGSKVHGRFPEQKKMSTCKPLLSDVIDAVEKYLEENKTAPVFYNIETKSTPDGDEKFHPAPDNFAELLYAALADKKILSRCIIQSFDPRTLQYIHKKDPFLKTALLVANAEGMKTNIERLGYTPDIYSPNFILLNKALVKQCHSAGMKVIPWTVNDEKMMKKVYSLGADGLITDYPDNAISLFSNKGF